MSLTEKLSDADRKRGDKEVKSAEKLGCDCKPTADVQEGGVVLAHGPDCKAFGRAAFEKLAGEKLG